MEVEYRDPADLRLHSILKAIPMLADDDEEFEKLCDSIAEDGVIEPLKVTITNLIADGRHRWKAAKRVQLKEVPVIVIKDAEIASVAINSILRRRHLSKGALAYMTFPLMEPAFKEAAERRMQVAKAGGKNLSTLSVLRSKTVEELAENIGVGRTLFFQARDVHKAFETKPELREQFETDIITGEIGLGAVKAGIAGQESTKGKAKPKEDQLELFTESFETLTKRFKYWQKFDDAERKTALQSIVQTVKTMPPDLRSELKKALAKIEKEEKQSE